MAGTHAHALSSKRSFLVLGRSATSPGPPETIPGLREGPPPANFQLLIFPVHHCIQYVLRVDAFGAGKINRTMSDYDSCCTILLPRNSASTNIKSLQKDQDLQRPKVLRSRKLDAWQKPDKTSCAEDLEAIMDFSKIRARTIRVFLVLSR